MFFIYELFTCFARDGCIRCIISIINVIRYFGGIKLGSNGLIRSYSHTISETLINNIKDLEYGYLIKIIENYDKINTIEYILKDSQIISKQFLDKIIIYAIINKKILENFSNIHYEILEEKII